MTKVIEDLYYGNICPGDQVVEKDSRYAKAQEITVSVEDELSARLDEAGKAMLAKLASAYNEMLSIGSREMFTQGFRLGLRLGMEVMDEGNGDLKDLISTLR
jgi:hypothetical protein